MGGPQTVPPRKETFFHMLKFTFCPTFTVASFIFFITLIDVLLFITLTVYTNSEGTGFSPDTFLGAD